MRFRHMRLRIGRVTLDAPLGDGVTAVLLGEAIEAALASRLRAPSAELAIAAPARTQPLASAIADGIADRIGAARGGGQ
jgi:hypothetical protein